MVSIIYLLFKIYSISTTSGLSLQYNDLGTIFNKSSNNVSLSGFSNHVLWTNGGLLPKDFLLLYIFKLFFLFLSTFDPKLQ